MKKFLLITAILFVTSFLFADPIIIRVKNDDYNQVQIHNLSSIDKFNGKLYSVKKNGDSYKKTEVLGSFNIRRFDDQCTITKMIYEGDYISIEFPPEYDNMFSYTTEHKDFPFFDVLVIHLEDIDE